MKYSIVFITALILLLSCSSNTTRTTVFVENINQLNKAIKKAVAGDEIVLANGVWKDVEINFFGLGTKQQPITLRAETSGNVFIEGASYLHLGGEYLVIDGLYFRNGYTPKSAIIRYMIGKDSIAYNCRITNTVIEDFTKPNRLFNDRWIEFFGKHNQLDHCYISGKSNDGETLRVFFTGNEHIDSHHQIVNNYFGPRPRKGGPRAETIRVGDSKTRVSPGYVNISNNYFEACNGEVEIISDKTNFNSYKNNIFYKCEGSLVLRHGSYAKVDGNIFIGGDDSDFYGGIRVVNSGHWITNNYFYKIKGKEFRAPLALMNGIPMTPLNRYLQVSDAVIAYNTWVDCKSPWQIGVGQNLKSVDVLPASEIRSAPPIRSTISNNIIYNTTNDENPVVNQSSMDGILFKNNVIDNDQIQYTNYPVLQNETIEMKKLNDWLYVPVKKQNHALNQVFIGYDFGRIENDLFGASRAKGNTIGAITSVATAETFKIDKKKYGPSWFSLQRKAAEPNIIKVSSSNDNLEIKIQEAENGDIIELIDDSYIISTSLKINKTITIRSKNANKKSKLVFIGEGEAPAFEMSPKGNISLENLELIGNNKTYTFTPQKEKMASAYNIAVENCVIDSFNHVLKAYKGSFADSIAIKKSIIKNCKNGFVLAAEDKGDYNAEMFTIDQCTFENIDSNVVNFYRGGYDESTIGGVLTITNSQFSNCGKAEKSKILLQTRGIINVAISNNTFKNNPVKLIALLWGEKNNHHSNNTTINSGQIKVEDQQKLKILY